MAKLTWLSKEKAKEKFGVNAPNGVYATRGGKWCAHDRIDSWCSSCEKSGAKECPNRVSWPKSFVSEKLEEYKKRSEEGAN